MNGAQLHLLVNHIPTLAPAFAVPFCIWSYLKPKSQALKAASALLVMGSLGALLSLLSGEPAEDIALHIPEVTKLLIHQHENAAKLASLIFCFVGISSALHLYLSRKGKDFPFSKAGALIGSLLVLGLMANAAHLGGLIHHQELRASYTVDPLIEGQRFGTGAPAKSTQEDKE